MTANTDPAFISKSAELRDELEPSAKAIADIAQRYQALGEAKASIEKQRDQMRDVLMSYVEHHGAQQIEGVGQLRIQERNSYSYDVKAIREQEPQRFQELLELDCVEISRKKAIAHERLSWLKAWEIPGASSALVIDKERA